jgi:DnaJ-class molecular chaperone
MAENVCRECKGTGKIGAVECPICGGTGVVYEEMGGA